MRSLSFRSPPPTASFITWASCQVRREGLSDATHAERVGAHDADRAEVLQDRLGGHRPARTRSRAASMSPRSADAAGGRCGSSPRARPWPSPRTGRWGSSTTGARGRGSPSPGGSQGRRRSPRGGRGGRRPAIASRDSSSVADSPRPSRWIATWMSFRSATDRAASRICGNAPVSSCTLKPPAPQASESSRNCSCDALARDERHEVQRHRAPGVEQPVEVAGRAMPTSQAPP